MLSIFEKNLNEGKMGKNSKVVNVILTFRIIKLFSFCG
jgi:hypothetical protein